jgi:hypothetical protein
VFTAIIATGYDVRAPRRVGSHDTVVPQQAAARRGDQDREFLDQLEGIQQRVRGAENRKLRDILGQQEMREALARHGLVTNPGSPEDLARIAKAEYEMWGRVVREANIRPE